MRAIGRPAGTAALVFALALTATGARASCEGCHGARDRPAGAGDLSVYLQAGAAHHPVDRAYPRDDGRYAQPNASDGLVRFFDRNGNGVLDEDEPRLSAAGTLDCASCHRAHGESAAPTETAQGYLRGSNAASALCRSCHLI